MTATRLGRCPAWTLPSWTGAVRARRSSVKPDDVPRQRWNSYGVEGQRPDTNDTRPQRRPTAAPAKNAARSVEFLFADIRGFTAFTGARGAAAAARLAAVPLEGNR